MKLRLKGNSIRLRLSKTEVETLALEGLITEKTDFGDTAFVYRLKKDDNNHLGAVFQPAELTVYIPHGFANDWPHNPIVGIDNKAADGSYPDLFILIEKDFKCLDNTEEDQADNYDNPKAC